jgi:hypothetical protein
MSEPDMDILKSIRSLWETLIEQRAENSHLPESECAKLDAQIEDYENRFGSITRLDETIHGHETGHNIKSIKNMDDLKKKEQKEELKGRAAALSAYREANPDVQEEPDDDMLHDFHGSRYSELEGKYNKLNEPNIRLAEQVTKDPRLAALFSEIAGENPKSFPYAVGRIFGKEGWGLEGKDLEEFEAGYQENLKQLAESEKLREQATENIGKYETTLSQYVTDNGLTEEQSSEIHNGIMKVADNLLMGIVPVELIDWVRKGLNYEKDVQEAVDTGFAEGKNANIDAKLKKPEVGAVPDLGNNSGAGKNKVKPPKGGLGFPDEW